LLIDPDLTPWKNDVTGNKGRFTGTVKITLDVKKPTNEIVLHAHELKITSVKFTSPDDASIRMLVNNSFFINKNKNLLFLMNPELRFDARIGTVESHSQWCCSCEK
jgi:aminopeptidase N